ncbi:MAG: tripartite tricarboxylate transporter substrate binding protein [Polaromonas sp.]|nr:tripartite tricarboxylate transporter substrate binding protein [Polaromonas sp.]
MTNSISGKTLSRRSRRACLSRLVAGTLFAAVLAAGAGAGPALAQAWPGKPVRLIVPFPAGAAPDVIARLVADRLGAAWGQAVFVENRPGAGGIPGMAALVRSPADGYTLGFVPAAVVTLTPELYKNPQFNIDTELTPVAAIGTSPMMVVVNASSDIKTLADLIASAKAQPGKVNFAAAQTNSVPHLTGEMLARATGMAMYTVPYSGSATATTALLSNEAVMTVDGLPALTQYVKAGKFRALAVTSKERLPGFDNIPTAGETVKGFESIGWFSVYAPAGTPASVVAQVNQDINKVIQAPDLVARLAELGVYPKPGSPKALAEFVQGQRAAWKKAVAELGLQPQ